MPLPLSARKRVDNRDFGGLAREPPLFLITTNQPKPPLKSKTPTMTDMYDDKKVPEFALPPYPHEDHGAEVSFY